MFRFSRSRFTQLVMIGLLGGLLNLTAGVRDGAAWVGAPDASASVTFRAPSTQLVCTFNIRYRPTNGTYISLFASTTYLNFYVGDKYFDRFGAVITAVNDDANDTLETCGLSSVNIINETFPTAGPISQATEISLSFTAIIDNAVSINNLTSGGPVTGNGTTTYTFTFSLSGDADSAPTITATVVPVSTISSSAPTVTDVTEGPTAEETQKVVATFMTNRANHVLSHQPDIIGFVDGSNLNGGGPLGNLGLNANGGGVNLGFSTSRSRILAAQNQPESQNQNTASSDDNVQLALAPKIEEVVQTGYGYGDAAESRTGTYDVWTELYGSKTNAGTSDSSYWVGYVGGHYFINEQTLVGVVGQYDWSEESNLSVNSNANGQGWMIGPYLAGQLPDQKLYYEARASWGQSTNKVSPNGTYTDAFDTTRWLVNAKISGSYALDHLILKPAISVSYYEETQQSYTDTNANVIPEQTISIGELKFGPTLTNNIKLDNGLLFQPSFGVNGVYNFAIKENAASQGAALGNDDLRARVDAGFKLVDQDKGRSISASGFYDGIGINNYQSYGGKVRLTLSFN